MTEPLEVLVIAGARPNFMKVAPLLRELRRRDHRAKLVHTGQHYDANMSDAFFRDLELPAPDYHLGVGSGSHAVQTARVMEAFEPVLTTEAPDWVVVVGDVNSTLACALVSAKLQPSLGVRVAHVEAGLRSGDWSMPEEVNRVLTDRLSDLLLTPSRDARSNLEAEGVPDEKIQFVGNVMIDTLIHQLPLARERAFPQELGLEGEYAVATLHRPSNVDSEGALKTIMTALGAVAERMPVVIPLHPRTRAAIQRFGLEELLTPLTALDPLGYRDMVSLFSSATLVLTDSGGLQEETTALGVPCVTLREQTERPITLTQGTNRLAPWPLSLDGVLEAAEEAVRERDSAVPSIEGWDGAASARIVKALVRGIEEPDHGLPAPASADLNPTPTP